MKTTGIPFAISWVCLTLSAQVARSAEFALRDQELATRLEVGYAVRLVDMNSDQRLDIAIVDSKRFLWLENPSWREHVMFAEPTAKFDNVCFAPSDIDGDGDLDFAVGRDWQFANSAQGGTIGWLRNPGLPNPGLPNPGLPNPGLPNPGLPNPGRSNPGLPDQPWSYHFIAEEPTTHRMQFIDLDEDQRPELVVSPLKGRNSTAPHFQESGVRQLAFRVPQAPATEPWPMTVINDTLHVTHNFCSTQWDQDAATELLFVGFEGVVLLDRDPQQRWQPIRIGAGEQDTPPNRGASEIKLGRLGSGRRYIATIEPWHGDRVVVYLEPTADQPATAGLWPRMVLDRDLKWGHAVTCVNLDQDADEELVIGVRDDAAPQDPAKRRGVRLYDPSDSGRQWTRQLVDPGSVAIEDLAAGDLNQDGRTDLVAVGRQTHNVKVYWNETK